MAFKFSDEARGRIKALRSRYPDAEAVVIPALYIGQDEQGWVSPEVIDAVAVELDVPRTHVLATATFYTMFNKKPVGRFHLQVCTNVACSLTGGNEIVSALKEHLEIETGETTRDGLFTLNEVECLAACGTAPVMQVNDDYHEGLDVSGALAIVKGLAAGNGTDAEAKE